MASSDELLRLKARVASLQQEHDRAQGAKEQVLARIQKEFGCDTIEEAKAKLEELGASAKAAERKFDKALTTFRDKHKDLLEK